MLYTTIENPILSKLGGRHQIKKLEGNRLMLANLSGVRYNSPAVTCRQTVGGSVIRVQPIWPLKQAALFVSSSRASGKFHSLWLTKLGRSCMFSLFPPWGIHRPYQARHWETWEYPSIINPACRQQHGKTTVSNACLFRNSLTHCFEPGHNTRSTRSPVHIIATSGHNKLDSISHLVWSLNFISQNVHTHFLGLKC